MTLSANLAELEANGLVKLIQLHPEIEYLFRHALIQSAAYASLVRADRRRLHQAAGEALERLYPPGPAQSAQQPVLAHHFAEAGDYARSIRYYTLAGQAAAEGYANMEALHLYGRALDLSLAHGGDPEAIGALFLKRGRVYELSAQDATALETYQALETWARAGGYRAALLAALNARASLYVRLNVVQNLALGQTLSQEALALAGALGDRAGEARALWNLMQHALNGGQFAEAVTFGERGLALTASAADPAAPRDLRETRAFILTDLLKVYFQVRQPQRALASLAEAGVIWRELGALNMLADNLGSTSMMHTITGNFPAALAASAEAHRLARQIGNVWNEAYARYLVPMIYFEQGDCGRAVALAAQNEALAARAGFAEGEFQAVFDQALMTGYLGELPRALALARQVEARAEALSGRKHSWPQIEALVPLLYVFADRPAEAGEALRGSAFAQTPQALEQQFVLTVVLVLQVQAELALRRGDADEALRRVEQMITALRDNGTRLFLTDALELRGRALHAAGRLAEAHTTLEAAWAEAEALGSRRSQWTIAAALAALAVERGEAAAAEQWRAAAQAGVAYLLAHAGSDELRATFRQRAAVRAVLAA